MEFLHHADKIIPWMLSLMLTWVRFFSFFYMAQLFRQFQVTTRVLNILAMAISLFAVSVDSGAALSDAFIYHSAWYLWLWVMIKQCLVGFILSSILNVVIAIFVSAGQIISAQLGLTFASLVDPRLGYVTQLTQFYVISATIIFFASPLFLDLIKILVQSMKWIPLSGDLHWDESKRWLISLFSLIYLRAVQLSLPIILVAILCQVGMMTVSRFAPQFNMMSVGASLLLIVGLLFVCISFPYFIEKAKGELNWAIQNTDRFVRSHYV